MSIIFVFTLYEQSNRETKVRRDIVDIHDFFGGLFKPISAIGGYLLHLTCFNKCRWGLLITS